MPTELSCWILSTLDGIALTFACRTAVKWQFGCWLPYLVIVIVLDIVLFKG